MVKRLIFAAGAGGVVGAACRLAAILMERAPERAREMQAEHEASEGRGGDV